MMGDPEVYRTKEDVSRAREVEPLVRLGKRLREIGRSDADINMLEAEAEAIIADAIEFAEASPIPDAAEALTEVFS
jgi:pyruvate dehydrogenase E1 component alpha subunit